MKKSRETLFERTEAFGSVESRRDEKSAVRDGKKAGKLYLNGPKHSGLLNPDARKKSPITKTGKKSRETLFKQTEELGSVESRRDEKSPITKTGKKHGNFI